MTAISAAIVELEAHREHVCQVIATLRRFERVVEDAHAQPAEVEAVVNGVAAVRAVSARVSAAEQATLAAKPTVGSSHDGIVLHGVAAAMHSARKPVSVGEIATETGHLGRDEVREALKRLVRAKQVIRTGKTSGQRYSLSTSKLRPGAVAGTQAAPPVGPPSASGTSGGSGRPAPSGPFETVWNGTMERNGDAPSILPPRERKA